MQSPIRQVLVTDLSEVQRAVLRVRSGRGRYARAAAHCPADRRDRRLGGMVVDGSASNWASLGDPQTLARLESDPDRWHPFLDHEVAACGQPGARDGGTHILFAAEPRTAR